MFKKAFSVGLILLTASCGTFGSDTDEGQSTYASKMCPYVTIKKESYYTNSKDIEVELLGFESYCYGENKAIVQPSFRITRLKNSDETDVHFSYYTNIIKGPPEYLGKKTYYAVSDIANDDDVKVVKGQKLELPVPHSIEVELGLNTKMPTKGRK